jgi:hypothetical protein
MPSDWGMTPKQSIARECSRRGATAVAADCVTVLQGGEYDDDLLFALAGPAARTVLDGREGGRDGYWPRVWALRGLLHNWSDSASPAVLDASSDEAWRVREMSAKVVGAHRVDTALDAMLHLEHDLVPRVRAAAQRAVRQLTTS